MSIDQNAVTFAKALADATRQEIMKLLCCQWMSVNDVVDALGGRVNQPTVSHHLKLLAEAKLVDVRQEGRQRFYTLNQEHFTVCCGALMRSFAPDFVNVEFSNTEFPATLSVGADEVRLTATPNAH